MAMHPKPDADETLIADWNLSPTDADRLTEAMVGAILNGTAA